MMRVYAALLLCGVMSCGGSSPARTAPDPASAPTAAPAPAPAPDSATPNVALSGRSSTAGVFEYVARIKGNEIKGRFAISGKIVIFDLPDGTCHPTLMPDWTAATIAARYECRHGAAADPVHFTIDVRSPLSRSTWEMTSKEQRQRSVCIEYVNRGGRNVCARSQTQTYDVVVPYSGALFVRPAEVTRQPHPDTASPPSADDPSGASALRVPC